VISSFPSLVDHLQRYLDSADTWCGFLSL